MNADPELSRASRWGRLIVTGAPAATGVVLAIVAQLAVPQDRLYLYGAPSLVALLAGLLSTALLAGLSTTRRRTTRRLATAHRQAEAAGREAAAARREAATARLEAATAQREAAARAAQDRHRFLLRLDHELKNPLTAIRAGLANAGDPDGGDPQSAASAATALALASVSAQTDRIARLVSELRKLADLETRDIEFVPVDLPELLEEVADAARAIPGAGERTVALIVPRVPWPLPRLDGDRDLLFLATQNLVANAVKFSRPGDTIEIRAREDGDDVLVEVADTGSGIPADEIGQVWQELARGQEARSVPGTGIGLALVRVIVTRHGGRVSIRSRAGQGTVVGFCLPAAGHAQLAPDVADLRQRRDTAGTPAP